MFRALVSFSGVKISMVKGEVKEIKDAEIVKDLLNAKYIEAIEPDVPKAEGKPKPRRKRKEAE